MKKGWLVLIVVVVVVVIFGGMYDSARNTMVRKNEAIKSDWAQVSVVLLHMPLAHTTVACSFVHVPLCSPSLGSCFPSRSSASHTWAVRLQYVPPVQSESRLQPAGGTHVPLALQ